MRNLFTTLLAAALLCMALPATGSAQTRLTYSTFFPPANHQAKLAALWCEEVEKRTNGEVVIDFYPGQTLTKAPQCYDGVVEGISDIGFSVLAYSRGRFPVMAAVDLPLGYKSAAQATTTANAVYEKFTPEELDDVEVMYFHGHGPGLLFTTEKGVRTLEDMQGLKIRSTGNSAKLVKALGGTPVAKSMSENYQLLQKGVVDGSMHPIESNKSFKLGEVCKFGTDNFDVAYTTVFFIVMNKSKWGELAPEHQAIIREINKEWATRHAEAWDAADVEGRQFLIDKGGEVVQLTPEESAKWVKAAQPVLDNYVEETNGKGLEGRVILEFTKSTIK